MKKGVLRNFTKFTGKHLCQSQFFNKVAGLKPFTEHLWWTASWNGLELTQKVFNTKKPRFKKISIGKFNLEYWVNRQVAFLSVTLIFCVKILWPTYGTTDSNVLSYKY